MSIRPIDMHVMVQNTSDVNKFNNETIRTDIQQQMFSGQLKKAAEQDANSVVQTNKAEKQSIEDEEKEESGYSGYNKKNKSKKKKENKPDSKPKESNLFDVTI